MFSSSGSGITLSACKIAKICQMAKKGAAHSPNPKRFKRLIRNLAAPSVKRIKTRGDRIEPPCGRASPGYVRYPLIPSIVAIDSFDSAIANAFVRLHFDKPFNLHSNGVENKFQPCLSFHKNNNLVAVKTTDSLDSAPPLELRVLSEREQTPIRVDVCFL